MSEIDPVESPVPPLPERQFSYGDGTNQQRTDDDPEKFLQNPIFGNTNPECNLPARPSVAASVGKSGRQRRVDPIIDYRHCSYGDVAFDVYWCVDINVDTDGSICADIDDTLILMH
jgi:hypothetical protein